MKNTYKVNEEAAKKIVEKVYDNGSTVINRNDIEEIFPELKGSEDERIRKAIIRHFQTGTNYTSFYGLSKNKILSWLEKQGEQKLTWSEEDEHRVKDTIYFLDTAKKHYASIVEIDACIEWLKSLKGKYS